MDKSNLVNRPLVSSRCLFIGLLMLFMIGLPNAMLASGLPQDIGQKTRQQNSESFTLPVEFTNLAQVYDANGKRAKNVFVIGVQEKTSLRLKIAGDGGVFLPQLLDENGELVPLPTPETPVRKVKGALMEYNADGVIRNPQKMFCYLVFSSDGKSVAFVPPTYFSSVQLRKCGTVVFDPFHISDEAGTTSVTAVWKNCLAGLYAKCGNMMPGDPKDPNKDWRFRHFISVSFACDLEPGGEKKQVMMPPGEVAVLSITKQQQNAIQEFKKGNLTQQIPSLAVTPAMSEIVRLKESMSYNTLVRPGICLKGTLKEKDAHAPDWDSERLIGAKLEFSVFPMDRLDWLPGYDMSKGVNHYYRVLNDEEGLGRIARTRALFGGAALVNKKGKFLSMPMPAGEYGGHLYHLHMRDGSDNRIGLPVTREISAEEQKADDLRMHTIKALEYIWQGKLDKANLETEQIRDLDIADAQEIFGRLNNLVRGSFGLRSKYRSNDPIYNAGAARHSMELANEFFIVKRLGKALQLLGYAAIFPGGDSDDSDNSYYRARSLKRIADAKRSIFTQPAPFKLYGAPRNSVVSTGEELGGVFDVGTLDYQTGVFDHPGASDPDFNPLRKLAVQPMVAGSGDALSTKTALSEGAKPAPKSDGAPLRFSFSFPNLDVEVTTIVDQMTAISDKRSEEYQVALANLRLIVEKMLERNFQQREEELSLLEEKLALARKVIEQRKQNSDKIIERRVRKLLEK